jgi:O-acetyl-ADP-ribose deacetylase (regulator of RNase III)
MIRVLHSSLSEMKADPVPEAILRSVSSNLESDTPFSREVEVRAGADLARRLQAMGELPLGAAVITPGGDLPFGFLIHLVLHSDEERVSPARLRSALANGLRRAGEWEIESLLLPCLGTGAGNMDAQESAEVMIPVIMDHIRAANHPREILVLVGTEYEREVFTRAVEKAPARGPTSDSAPPGSPD